MDTLHFKSGQRRGPQLAVVVVCQRDSPPENRKHATLIVTNPNFTCVTERHSIVTVIPNYYNMDGAVYNLPFRVKRDGPTTRA